MLEEECDADCLNCSYAKFWFNLGKLVRKAHQIFIYYIGIVKRHYDIYIKHTPTSDNLDIITNKMGITMNEI